ncbi:hypothetical protein F4815DRAFT_305817 [Daldinia loculata]|nr:hypothetical protein F4815DRAFT_305817 [Daldinia loculata]
MEIERDCIISAESYEKFGLNRRRHDTNQRVQNFIDRGLMSKDAVYRRFTEDLKYSIGMREDEPLRENIRQAFCQLCDPDTGYLSQNKFKHLFEKILPTASPGVPALLLDIFSWHAFFPFPSIYTASGEPCIDEDAFVRAVCQLAWTRSPRHNLRMEAGAGHCVITGNWGPHFSWLMLARGKDVSDYMRWLFRSLAIPNNTKTGIETTILVPRFFMYQPRQDEPYSGDDSEDEALQQQVVIVEKESERTIDIQDILSEYPPDHHTMVADPLREGYKLALPFLPHHPYDLTDLHVPTVKVLSLFPLLYAGDGSDEERELAPEEEDGSDIVADLITSTERLGNEGLSWEVFDTMLSEHAELVADTLARIFSVFKAPIDGTAL